MTANRSSQTSDGGQAGTLSPTLSLMGLIDLLEALWPELAPAGGLIVGL